MWCGGGVRVARLSDDVSPTAIDILTVSAAEARSSPRFIGGRKARRENAHPQKEHRGYPEEHWSGMVVGVLYLALKLMAQGVGLRLSGSAPACLSESLQYSEPTGAVG